MCVFRYVRECVHTVHVWGLSLYCVRPCVSVYACLLVCAFVSVCSDLYCVWVLCVYTVNVCGCVRSIYTVFMLVCLHCVHVGLHRECIHVYLDVCMCVSSRCVYVRLALLCGCASVCV